MSDKIKVMAKTSNTAKTSSQKQASKPKELTPNNLIQFNLQEVEANPTHVEQIPISENGSAPSFGPGSKISTP